MQINFGRVTAVGHASVITSEYFGAVVKMSETRDADLMVQGTHFDISMDHLNIGSIRYPGGTEAIRLFDFLNPSHIEGLHKAIDYCADEGLALNFTLSDLKYFYKTNGPIVISEKDRQELENFIKNDLLAYARDKGVSVESIRVGNEFLGKLINDDGPMLGESATGYGKNAASIVNALDAIMDQFAIEHPSFDRPEIVVESAGWPNGAQSIINQLIKYGAASKVDAIDLHGAYNGDDGIPSLNLTWDQLFGTALSDEPGDTYAERMQKIIDIWRGNPLFADINLRMDAWAFPTNSLAGTALINAGLAIMQFHTFSEIGITSATNYISYGWDNSSLIVKKNPDGINFDVEGRITAGGEVFRMMSLAIEGKRAIDLSSTPSDVQEASSSAVVRAFAGEGEIVLYVISRSSNDINANISLEELITSTEIGVSGITISDISIIGSGNPEIVTDRRTGSSVEVIGTESGANNSSRLTIHLDPFEIAQITIIGNGKFGSNGGDQVSIDVSGTVHGLEGDDLINGSEFSDTLAGGDGSDSVNGGNGNDLIFGGKGADRIFGGGGADTLSFHYEESAILLDLANTPSSTGGARGDIYSGIETFQGSSFSDTISGDSSANNLVGGAGNDLIDGRAGNDALYGGIGDDTLQGGSGVDLIIGGDGFDFISYSGSRAGVRVGLGDNSAATGDAVQDSFLGIEGVIGSRFNDVLKGDRTSNLLFGGNGRDRLDGWGGDDTLQGGSGADLIFGGDGFDFISYSGSRVGVRVGLGDNSAATGDAVQDSFFGIEGVIGSRFNDILKGDRTSNVLFGGNGRDRLDGWGGDDLIFGGIGFDFIYGGADNDTLLGGAGRDNLFGGAGQDVFSVKSISDSTLASMNRDTIFDFTRGQDRIDLSSIDASVVLGGDNAFVFRGTKPNSTSNQGEIYFKIFNNPGTKNDFTVVYLDNDGDRQLEAAITVIGIHNFTADDFIL